MLLYGWLFAHTDNHLAAPHVTLRSNVIYGVLLLQVITLAYLCLKHRQDWGVILAMGVPQLWLAWCAGFVAAMSVTNVWL